MRRLLSLLTLVAALFAGLLAGLFAGCDAQRAAQLEEGLATEADVRAQYGEPVQVIERADGSKLLAYPRQP